MIHPFTVFDPMRKHIAIIVCAVLVSAPAAVLQAREAPQQPGTYVTMTSDEGLTRLARSRYKADFWKLSAHFATQVTQTLCSVATAVTVLNSLGLPRPVDPVYAPYRYFTQSNYFNEGVMGIRDRETTLTEGMTLQMAARAMRVHGARTEPYHAEKTTLDEFRALARENLGAHGNYIVVNYQRTFIGQPRGAHFSPLGAYDAGTDTFLILDVARYKFPPVWARAEDLFAAMNTQDSEVAKSRGFIVVSAAP